LNPEIDRQLWLSSYVQTYLERDVRDLVQVGDLNVFARFLALAAGRSGQLLKMSELARDVGVSAPTIRRWISVLEASGIVHLLEPYHRNFGKRVVKAPKLIFLDPGLAAFLVGLHQREAILQGPSVGALTETAVVGECVKRFRQQGEVPALFFWSSPSGLEVDLLIERNQRLYAIEVKWTATPTPAHAAALARWLELATPEVQAVAAVVACRVDAPMSLGDGVRAVPWHLAWVG